MRQSRTTAPRRGDVDARRVAAEVAALAPVDVEALDRRRPGRGRARRCPGR